MSAGGKWGEKKSEITMDKLPTGHSRSNSLSCRRYNTFKNSILPNFDPCNLYLQVKNETTRAALTNLLTVMSGNSAGMLYFLGAVITKPLMPTP